MIPVIRVLILGIVQNVITVLKMTKMDGYTVVIVITATSMDIWCVHVVDQA